MCYKEDIQRKNEKKLYERFAEDGVPLFIQNCIAKTRSSNSMACCVNTWAIIKDLLLWVINQGIINKNNISDLTPDDFSLIKANHVSRYLQYKEDSGLSPTTMETRKNVIRGFWNRLAEQDICDVDVVKMFHGVDYKGISSANNLIKKLPTDRQLEDIEKNILAAHDEFLRVRNLAVFMILKGTGIRESELCGLAIDDLYLDEDMPYITVVGKGKYRAMENRMVYLSNSAYEVLKEWLVIRDQVQDITTDALFITKKRKRMSEGEVRNLFKNKSRGEVTPHMMRHWYATVVAQKCGIAFAQQQLGHTSVNTTINNYANGSYGVKNTLMTM